jgi:hypothetical protein
MSQDAIVRDAASDRKNYNADGAESTGSEPKGQELSYAAHER